MYGKEAPGINSPSLYTCIVKGCDPLNGKHCIRTLPNPNKVGTLISCPHVSDIKVGNTVGGPCGATKFGSPKNILYLYY